MNYTANILPSGVLMDRSGAVAPFPSENFSHIDGFRAKIRDICGSFAAFPQRSDGIIQAQLGLKQLANYDIAEISLCSVRTERDEAMIRRHPNEHVFLILQDKGAAVMREGDSAFALREGDLFVYDSLRPAQFAFSEHSRQLSFHLPRSEALGRFGRRLRSGVCLKREEPLSIAMRSVLQRLLRDTSPPGAATALIEAYLSVFAAYLNDIDDGESALTEGSRLLVAALREIDRQCADPNFGPPELAARLGVSIRTLQRAFQMVNDTPRQRILAVRLDRTHNALRASEKRTITEIAYDQGFNDLSHFYRVFRERFGMAPGEVAGPLDGT